MSQLRTVLSIPPRHGEFQKLYLDTDVQPRWLRPNLVFVHPNGSVDFETNELGLKGSPLDPSRKQAVVWGDSPVFGCRRSWPEMLDEFFPGYQFLNGGIEGDGWDTILRRAAKLNREFDIASESGDARLAPLQ